MIRVVMVLVLCMLLLITVFFASDLSDKMWYKKTGVDASTLR
jgi:hypothetical protein